MKKVLLYTLVLLLAVGCTSRSKTSADLSGLTADLNPESREMLDLLLRYLAVESGSMAIEGVDFPMTDGQMEMARILKSDIESLGIPAVLSEWGYVYAEIPSNIEEEVPVFGISCHLDYTPEAPGRGIKPIVITYNGGDILLPDGSVISPSSADGVELPELIGKTIIHSDGTTLLGADDKNGCTISMSVMKTILKSGVKHGKIQFVFCPNEDIGMAAEKIDPAIFNPDVLFDVDGEGGCEIAASNFTARDMEVKFFGNGVHASDAKQKKLANSVAAKAAYIAYFPLQYLPERTEGLEGYIHHWKEEKEGDYNYTVFTRIRYFDQAEGKLFKKMINDALEKTRAEFPEVQITVIKDVTVYDNVEYSMYPGSRQIIDRAAARCGQTIKYKDERGGTTAAMFTAKGLKGGMCIYSGQHNFHTPHEYACLEEMLDAYKLLLHAIDEVANEKR